jgi:hypothetical protein
MYVQYGFLYLILTRPKLTVYHSFFCCCSFESNSVPPASMLECISYFFTFAMQHRFAMRFCIGNCCHVFVECTYDICSAIKCFLAIQNLIIALSFSSKKSGTIASQLKTVKSLFVKNS